MRALHPQLIRPHTPLQVAVVGIGGTGSEVLSGLLNLHHALKAKGRAGLEVHAFDPDTVSPANLVRQRFSEADLGRNKAEVLTRRINAHGGTAWRAYPRVFQAGDAQRTWDLVLSCVDTRASRAGLHRYAFAPRAKWLGWMDFGNERDYGQVIYGEPGSRAKGRLLCATELLPEIHDTSLPEDDAPSCSALEALMKQDLFVNAIAARLGLQILWQGLNEGQLAYQGYYFNLANGSMNAIRLPPPEKPRRTRQAAPRPAVIPSLAAGEHVRG